MPQISIVMPVYNNEKFFPRAVESVQEQDFDDWELIIVDDGSTDRTSAIADQMASGDRHIKAVHQENQWIYASINNGIDAAAGDYIYILNSDDRLRPGSLKLMSDKVKKYNNPDVIWTKVLSHICDLNQKILKYDAAGLDRKVTQECFYEKEELRRNWPFLLSSFLVQNQANLYSRELLKKHRFRNDIYGADMIFNIDIASDIKTAVVMKEAVYDHFNYQHDQLNVSVGKYYSYEHDMLNEIYLKYRVLFKTWELPESSHLEMLSQIRLRWITKEIGSLSCKNCDLALNEKIKFAICTVPDQVVCECAGSIKAKEEMESRILSGLRGIFLAEQVPESSEMYFVYELLESLLRYEKDEEDMEKIRNAVFHPLNPAHIGKIFYDRLTNGQLLNREEAW